MAGHPADELREIYKELTRPGGYNVLQANIQTSWRQSATLRSTNGTPSTVVSTSTSNVRPDAEALSLPVPCHGGDVERCVPSGLRAACEKAFVKNQPTLTSGHNSPRANFVSVGLVDSSSVSTRTRRKTPPAQATQRHSSGPARNIYPSDMTKLQMPGIDGVDATVAELFLSMPGERRLACWLCETTCTEPGWLNAPEIYVSVEEESGINDRRFPVTLLTLCSRCSAACALPAAAPHDAVLRKAGATRALVQRTELFVQFLREYKLLLESLAGNAEKVKAMDATARAGGTYPSLWDLPSDFRFSVIQKLTDALTFTLEADALQSRRCQTSSLSPHERLLLEGERALLQRQMATTEPNGQLSVRLPRSADAPPSRLWTPSFAELPLSATGSGTQPRGLSHVFQHRPQYDMKKLDPLLQIRSTFAKAEQGGGQQEPQNRVVQGREASFGALQRMVGRALTARWRQVGDGAASLKAGTDGPDETYDKKDTRLLNSVMMDVTPNNAGGGLVHDDPENILLHYFEGRLSDLPKFKFFAVDTVSNGGNESGSLRPFRNSQRTPKRPCGDLEDASSDVVLVAADVAAAATMDAGELLKQLREEQRRRAEAEAALRESHQRIAALEKATDHISGLALDLNHTLGEHSALMQQFVRNATQGCVDFMMQKSLLFSDEMAAMVRQAQRQAYGVHARFPRAYTWEAVAVDSDVPPPAPVILQDSAHATSDAEPAPFAPSRLLPLSLKLTSLVPSDAACRI
ncbi:hypothetical protein TraAM80_07697 [Trypanosoma rangeli]|uniref:Uncharacterized protein n=1 Tax=Trypanosoma rangeli TaxID=5698 RepID=A0A422N4B0_TRYRA|nr:uncharacterized protein TraAM80_07697 [Trypanosoma rangeli]RNF00305.1 hypothetical protein TraAM80_07697 [Trypanosoma rangeli]|eukprot:RNF00305.1 hypothetical protein TraAM80_07697 [Trypanosoma rangeli]